MGFSVLSFGIIRLKEKREKLEAEKTNKEQNKVCLKLFTEELLE